MTDETRNLVMRRSALGLMGIGAVGVASETLGFTNVTAGRGVNIGVEDDPDATFKIEDDDSPGTAINDADFSDRADILFENTSSNGVTIDFDGEVTGDDAGDITLSDEGNINITNNTSFEVENDLTDGDTAVLGIDNDTTGGGEEEETLENLTVSIDADINGTSISVERDISIDP